MPYTADKPYENPSSEELRARIPGWGVDADPRDRPAVPREKHLPTGAHWDFPDRQPETFLRERSIEHAMLTPVFGTAQPLHGLSGAIRRFAYDRFSEGRAAHWLLLLAGDRVDAGASHLRSLLSTRPDNPITETGVLGEFRHHPITSRFGQRRTDTKHVWLDPLIVAGPWLLAAALGVVAVRSATKKR
ncbi:hypothetical protein WDJ51_09965 [Rathayibacter sp. YIM 133350]|uniref:hypothetical protein n=1 Tax=Rathayibacter sp. YIM 133350 TaxID=3131992 RepID=UPI00307D1054